MVKPLSGTHRQPWWSTYVTSSHHPSPWIGTVSSSCCRSSKSASTSVITVLDQFCKSTIQVKRRASKCRACDVVVCLVSRPAPGSRDHHLLHPSLPHVLWLPHHRHLTRPYANTSICKEGVGERPRKKKVTLLAPEALLLNSSSFPPSPHSSHPRISPLRPSIHPSWPTPLLPRRLRRIPSNNLRTLRVRRHTNRLRLRPGRIRPVSRPPARG